MRKVKITNKDLHDYINIYGMLILTGIIAYSTLFAIPKQIEEITENSGWERFYYQEAME